MNPTHVHVWTQINAKFSLRKHNQICWEMSRVKNSKFWKFKTTDILKVIFFSTSQPVIFRFRWNMVRRCQFRFREWSRNEKSKFPNTDAIFKIIFGYISAPYCPIKAKFEVKQNYSPRHLRGLNGSKIQDDGRPPFWKWISPRIARFRLNLSCRCAVWFRELSREQFFNSRNGSAVGRPNTQDFIYNLTCLLVRWEWRDRDGMDYKTVNNKTTNINAKTAVYIAKATCRKWHI